MDSISLSTRAFLAMLMLVVSPRVLETSMSSARNPSLLALGRERDVPAVSFPLVSQCLGHVIQQIVYCQSSEAGGFLLGVSSGRRISGC
jgi:hypothetical protein